MGCHIGFDRLTHLNRHGLAPHSAERPCCHTYARYPDCRRPRRITSFWVFSPVQLRVRRLSRQDRRLIDSELRDIPAQRARETATAGSGMLLGVPTDQGVVENCFRPKAELIPRFTNRSSATIRSRSSRCRPLLPGNVSLNPIFAFDKQRTRPMQFIRSSALFVADTGIYA